MTCLKPIKNKPLNISTCFQQYDFFTWFFGPGNDENLHFCPKNRFKPQNFFLTWLQFFKKINLLLHFELKVSFAEKMS